MASSSVERNNPNRRRQQMTGLLGSFFRFCLFLITLAGFAALLWFVSLRSKALQPYVTKLSENPSGAFNDLLASGNEIANEITRDDRFEIEKVVHRSTVETMVISRTESMVTSRTYSGVITPGQSSQLGFKRTGIVEKLMVDQGDKVSKGDTIAMLDVESLLADKAVLQADLQAAKSLLAELEAGPRTQTIQAAKAKLEELKSLADLWKVTMNRRSRLAAQSAGSQQNLDEARLQLAAASSRYNSQLEVVNELEEGTRKEKLEAQKATVEKLNASILSIDVRIKESKLTAPFDGVVSKRMVDEGMIVAPGSVIFRLIQTEKPEAWIGLPPKTAQKLEGGSMQHIEINGVTYSATLKCVLPELDPVTRTRTAVFTLPDIPEARQFGQLVRFRFNQTMNDDKEGFWIPRSALTKGVRGLWSVLSVEPVDDRGAETSADPNLVSFSDSDKTQSEDSKYTLKRRDVDVIQIESNEVLVRGTVQEGDRIVASGVQKLVADQIVYLKN